MQKRKVRVNFQMAGIWSNGLEIWIKKWEAHAEEKGNISYFTMVLCDTKTKTKIVNMRRLNHVKKQDIYNGERVAE